MRTSGATVEMKPVAWQPGFAMRLDAAIAALCAWESSGKP